LAEALMPNYARKDISTITPYTQQHKYLSSTYKNKAKHHQKPKFNATETTHKLHNQKYSKSANT
jgi:hypothetical protein